MSLSNKIINLRKKNDLSQEDLAEKVNVTRQTISNWETEQTLPDVNDAKKLAEVFKISLDDLLENDVPSIVVQKVSNTEKLAGMIIKILKVGGILLLVYFIVIIIVLLISINIFSNYPQEGESTILFSCSLNNIKYNIEISSTGNYICPNCDSKIKGDLDNIINYNDIYASSTDVQNYFIDNGGDCY